MINVAYLLTAIRDALRSAPDFVSHVDGNMSRIMVLQDYVIGDTEQYFPSSVHPEVVMKEMEAPSVLIYYPGTSAAPEAGNLSITHNILIAMKARQAADPDRSFTAMNAALINSPVPSCGLPFSEYAPLDTVLSPGNWAVERLEDQTAQAILYQFSFPYRESRDTSRTGGL